jgi:hypothetical protein
MGNLPKREAGLRESETGALFIQRFTRWRTDAAHASAVLPHSDGRYAARWLRFPLTARKLSRRIIKGLSQETAAEIPMIALIEIKVALSWLNACSASGHVFDLESVAG